MNTPIPLHVTEQPDQAKWSAFIASHKDGNIFQTPEMYQLFNAVPNYSPGVLAAVTDAGIIKGILLYNIISEPGIKKWLSSRSIIIGGPLVENNEPLYAALLLAFYKKKILTRRVIYTQIRNLCRNDFIRDTAAQSGFLYEDHLTIHINLTQSLPQLEVGMHKKRRANIRRVSKKNVVVKPVESMDGYVQVCKLVHKTYRRIKLPAPPDELLLHAKEKLSDRVRLFAAYYEGEMIACRIYLLYKGIMYDWYAGSDLRWSHLCPNDVLPWAGMLWGKDNNIHTYDFAGAGKPDKKYGVRTYKLRFGGDLINFGRYQCVHKPLLFRMGKFAIKLFRLFS